MSETKPNEEKAKEPIWPQESIEDGDWIQFPRVLVENFKSFDLKPGPFLLLLALQSARFKKNSPEFYWEQLSNKLGVSKSTVCRWGYNLQDQGWIRIKQKYKELPPGQDHKVGVRNDRNLFFFDGLAKKVVDAQKEWDKEPYRKTVKTKRRNREKAKAKG